MKNDNKIYVVAEIGHNHKGSIDEAKKLFKAAKAAGANAVKLQKRDNKSLYTKKFYNQIYENPPFRSKRSSRLGTPAFACNLR